MTLAEQVLQLKTDIDDVYNAGKKAGGTLDYDAVYGEGYDDGHEAGHSAGYSEGYDVGYDEGQKDNTNVYNPLVYANTITFPSCNVFGRSEVEINLGENITSLYCFITVLTEDKRNTMLERMTFNCSGLPTNMSAFMQCSSACRDLVLKKITLNMSTQNVTSFNNAFNCMAALEEIDGIPFDLSSATTITNMFNMNFELKEVRFKEKTINRSISFIHSSKLSTTSIQSIINGLADLTGQTGLTLTFVSAIADSLTDDQMSQILAKNWSIT